MAARRPVLLTICLAAAAAWLLSSVLAPAAPQGFAAPQPALRAGRGASAGAAADGVAPAVVLRALPEPKPNEEMLPVDLNRTSLYWGLFLFLCHLHPVRAVLQLPV
ncbi:unnamed protein product [Prorocentrum cordatum]|uniref:Uncharacterized protein n=1 Tax=Prorocentrum cordatum TaxID=2364126 RepID=A0ABN9SDR3_9DINO|nr:unnamed protein product [Polarella glacialis]